MDNRSANTPELTVGSFATVGVLGGGQLARMMAGAALRLGIGVRIYQEQDTGAAAGTATVVTGRWDDEAKLRRFVDGCDVVTLDNEWVPLERIGAVLEPAARLYPTADTMRLVSNKIRQKEHATAAGLPVGPYLACRNDEDLDQAAREFGFPLVVKRPEHSYDGYGNRTVADRDELGAAYEALRCDGAVLVEQWVPFTTELAVMVARRPGGQDVAYPVAATLQRDHRCEAVEVPAPISSQLQQRAIQLAREAARVYGCVGVVGVELFALEDGTLVVNEIAPRPHNTGHYTIDACLTSQFENHLRAILDLPLGETTLLQPAAAMVNVLGRRHGASSFSALAEALAVPGVAVHIYDKREVRPGRKMGHVTAVASDADDAKARAYDAAEKLEQ